MSDSRTLMPAVILAGGLATRLYPLTERIPKSLLEVSGKPFLWHQLRLLRSQGIQRVILLAGHLGDMIQRDFRDGSACGVSLEYSFDGPTLLGTGGAIRKALDLLPERFFVVYGDSYLTCSFEAVEEAFGESGKLALMTVYRNEDRFDSSNVEFEGGQILRYDKKVRTVSMKHIDYGLGVFRREVFAGLLSDARIDLEVLYQDLLRRGELAALEVTDRFYEIGSTSGLAETHAFLGGGGTTSTGTAG